jgi:DNA topoisomerase-3
VKLYIAEKPSVAKAIANQLSTSPKYRDGIYEAGEAVVVPLQGHVLEQAQPHEYDERYKQWKLEDLPIIPSAWKKKVRPEFKARVGTIGKLLKSAKTVVHAGDPDREGQLIVDEVLELLGYRGPVRRVLPNSIEDVDLRDILRNERDNREFELLSKAAQAREQNDFLVGISATRGVTLVGQAQGYRDMVFTVGRVQTPTLALVVRRERQIDNFVSVDHYGIKALVEHPNGTFVATWKPKADLAGMDAEGRLIDRKVAEDVVARLSGKSGRIVAYKDERKKQSAPLPFSLNALQKEAAGRFKISVAKVLEIAQALYDKPHTLTTYPRTDSKYLPMAQHEIAGEVLAAIAATSSELAPLVAKADSSRKSPAFKDTKEPHHAIVPTRQHGNLSGLNELERKLYDLVARTYIAQFYPPYEYRAIETEVEIDGERFVASGKLPVSAGWREVLPKKSSKSSDDEEDSPIPAVAQGDGVRCESVDVVNKKTEPPARFTQESLVDAMEHIDKFVDDPEIKKRLRSVKGIGTSATQSGIIEGLMTRGYLQERDHKLYAAPPAHALIEVLEKAVWPLTDPGLTALMEQGLEAVAEGRISLQQHTAQVETFIRKVIADLKTVTFPPPSANLHSGKRLRGGKKGSAKKSFGGKRKWQSNKSRKAS